MGGRRLLTSTEGKAKKEHNLADSSPNQRQFYLLFFSQSLPSSSEYTTMLDEYLSLFLPEMKWPEGVHWKSQQSQEGQAYLAHLLPTQAQVSQDYCCCELQMVGVTGSAEECYSQVSLLDAGDILEIPFLLLLFLLKAVGFCHNKPLSIRGVASFSDTELPPSVLGEVAHPSLQSFHPQHWPWNFTPSNLPTQKLLDSSLQVKEASQTSCHRALVVGKSKSTPITGGELERPSQSSCKSWAGAAPAGCAGNVLPQEREVMGTGSSGQTILKTKEW